MNRSELIKLLNKTGNSTDKVFMRGDNSSIIPIDNVIIIGGGDCNNELCLINGETEIPVKKAMNVLSNLCCEKNKFI